jgi:hypothetical protein
MTPGVLFTAGLLDCVQFTVALNVFARHDREEARHPRQMPGF